MKKYIVFMAVLSLLIILISFISSTKDSNRGSNSGIFPELPASAPQSLDKDEEKVGKVLVVYFSLTGNTDKVAVLLKDMTGGDIFKIEPDFDYTQVQSRKEMEELGKQQVEEGFQPELKNSVSSLEDYEYIIIGSPVWWYSVTPPVMSFLSQYDFADKKVVPFCTCVSAYGDFFKQFEAAIPDAKILKGLCITESELMDEEELNEKLKSWLEDIKLL